MKNVFYFIAGLLLVIWLIVFLIFDSSSYVHLLLIAVAIAMLIPPLISGKKGVWNTGESDPFDNL